MSIFEDTNPRELKELLTQIHNREAALPDFQRDFVWQPSETQELIISIAMNYPAGSLLRIRNTHDLFACREFQGAPVLNGHKATYLVLDGQQRLTSLYQAFFGVGEHRYFIDLRQMLDGCEFEECIFHVRANHGRAKRLEAFEAQAQELILPLSVLKGGAGGFGRWTRNVARLQPSDAERAKLEDLLSDIEERWIHAIDDYRFPVVTLADKTGADAVCTIFETLNRTGVKLSVFELLTARFWPLKVNLRSLWTKAKVDYPIIDDFDIDPYYVLQAVTLASHTPASCKRSDVLNLTVDEIRQWWDPAVAAMAKGLEILRDDCGVMTRDWLPYNTIVIPLAGILARLTSGAAHEVGANRQKLARWFWCSAFAQAYENAANSQAAKDVTELAGWMSGQEPPATVREFRFDPQVLVETTPKQRALYRGLFCLMLSRGPRDFHNGAKLTGDLIVEGNVDDHHVFPDAYLAKTGHKGQVCDCVLNRTLIDRKTNIRISDRPPSQYLGEIRQSLGEAMFCSLLESHTLPAGKDSPLLHDDFETFLEWRKQKLFEAIQQATGLEAGQPASRD